jgi:hypothetical protein
MRLSLEQIKSITTGAVDVTEGNGAVRFDRFTKPQLNMYINGRRADPWHGPRAMSPAGVKLSFRTDSEYLFIRVNTRPGYSWDVFSLDVEVNGEYIGGVDSYKTQKIPPIYNGNDLSDGCGRYTGRFELPCGENLLCIHMPYNAITELEDIELSDGASIIPVIPEKIYMAYGDSITQGLHSQRPSHRYTARLAKLLGAAEYNKAIAGEIFFPQLSKMPDDLSPDYITVAYGINDWFGWEREVTVKKMNEFYKNISEIYPDSKIFAISAI